MTKTYIKIVVDKGVIALIIKTTSESVLQEWILQKEDNTDDERDIYIYDVDELNTNELVMTKQEVFDKIDKMSNEEIMQAQSILQKSVMDKCKCGHGGIFHATLLELGIQAGYAACMLKGCDCKRFTFGGFDYETARAIMKHAAMSNK